jgi:alpha-1,6-mannosyltransferase
VLSRGVAGSILMAAGGYCYARLPRQTWMDRVAWLWSVRASRHHLTVGLSLAFAGLLLLTWAWWDLRRLARGDRAGLASVRRAAMLWALPLLVAPPLFSGDGWSYVATGDLAGRGLSPYAWTPAALPVPLRSGVSPAWLFTPSPYGPLPLAWGGALSHVSHDPWVLLAGYRLAAVLGLVLIAWAVPILAVRAGGDPVAASALAVASPFVLVHGVGGLHNDVVTAGLVAAAFVVTRERRWLAGAVLVGLAAAVKVPGAVAAVGVVLLSLGGEAGWRARLRRSGLVGGVVAGVVLAAGWVTGLGTGWIGALSVPDREHTVLALTSVLGRLVRSWLELAGPPGVGVVHELHPELLAKRLGLVVVVAAAGWVLMRTRVDSRRRVLAGAALVLTTAVVLSPVVHYWYFLWCLPVLACLPLRRAAEAALVATVVTLGVTAPADLAVHHRWLWTGSAWALLLVPAGAWLAVTLLLPRGARTAAAGEVGAEDAGAV